LKPENELKNIFKSKFYYRRFRIFERDAQYYATRELLVVFFCRAYLGWGRRKIALNTQLSERAVRNCYKQLKDTSGAVKIYRPEEI
jgi:hypothetical protein